MNQHLFLRNKISNAILHEMFFTSFIFTGSEKKLSIRNLLSFLMILWVFFPSNQTVSELFYTHISHESEIW